MMISPETAARYRFDDVIVDTTAFEVTKGGVRLDLEPRAIQVLVALIEFGGRLATKEELFQSVWREAFVTDNALTRVVAQLRKALGDDARNPRYIETVPTQGYRFIASVSAGEAPALSSKTPPGGTFRPWWLVPVAAALIGIAALAVSNRPRAPIPHKPPVQLTTSDGLDASPAFSPDGNLLAWASDRSGVFEIYVRPIAGGDEVRITNDGRENVQPAWSPDGQSIAFYSVLDAAIRVVPALGGVPRTVSTFGCEPAWSPDSKTLVFRSGGFVSLAHVDAVAPFGAQLWTVSVDGGEPRALTEPGNPPSGHGSPSWSPDGKRIVFTAGSVRQTSLWILEIATRAVRPIEVPGSWIEAVWSRDGKHIYAVSRDKQSDSAIYRISPDDPNEAPAPVAWTGAQVARGLAVGRNGIAYSSTSLSSNLWRLALKGRARAGEPEPLTRNTMVRNSGPSISPDGSMVAFHAVRRGLLGDIYAIPLRGGAERQLTRNPGFDFLTNWMPDGKEIVFSSTRGDERGLSSVSLDDGTERRVIATRLFASPGRLSPDGKHVVTHRPAGARLELLRAGFDGQPLVRISPPAESVGYGAWSPDGRSIAAEATDRNGTQAVILPREGGVLRRLTARTGHHWVYGWSPDSSAISMASNAGGYWNLEWISVDGKLREQWTDNRAVRVFLRYPVWSPKGDWAVYERAETKGNIHLVELAPR